MKIVTDEEIEAAEHFKIYFSPDGQSENQKQLCQLTREHHDKLFDLFGKSFPESNEK